MALNPHALAAVVMFRHPSRRDAETQSECWQFLTTICGLSGAECRVALLLSLGWRPARVAERLGLSVHTVHTHTQSIYGKLDLHGHAELVAWMASEGRPGTRRA